MFQNFFLLGGALRVAADGCSDVKSCPEPLGGGCGGGGEGRRNPVAWSEWRTSKFRRSPSRRRWCCELEQRNVTALNASPAGCNGVAWSARAPRRHRLRRRQPTRQRHLNWIKTSLGSTLSSLFFLFPPRLLRHGLSVFHTLTHSLTPRSLYYHPLLLYLRRGVVFRSPPATRGRPR